jgi:hypothetical protein
VKHSGAVALSLILVIALCCGPRSKSDKSFDEIRTLVQGKSSNEVEGVLGEPDSRQSMPLSGERWIWWDYTYLDGKNYAPEERGRVVHLEIIFEPSDVREAGTGSSGPDLRVSDPLAVSYLIPAGKS